MHGDWLRGRVFGLREERFRCDVGLHCTVPHLADPNHRIMGRLGNFAASDLRRIGWPGKRRKSECVAYVVG